VDGDQLHALGRRARNRPWGDDGTTDARRIGRCRPVGAGPGRPMPLSRKLSDGHAGLPPMGPHTDVPRGDKVKRPAVNVDPRVGYCGVPL
jgi:hypothetical protein